MFTSTYIVMQLHRSESVATMLTFRMGVALRIVRFECRVRLEGEAALVATQLRVRGEVMLTQGPGVINRYHYRWQSIDEPACTPRCLGRSLRTRDTRRMPFVLAMEKAQATYIE